MYRRALIAITLTACILATATACIPTSHTRLRWAQCKVVWFDATSSRAAAGYIAEVSKITGLNLVAGTAGAAEDHRIYITDLHTNRRDLGGRTTSSTGTDGYTDYVLHAKVEILPGAPAGIWRHELGHLFNLAHNPGSELMRETPGRNATYSATEIAVMRNVAIRSGCGSTIEFGGR